MVPQTSPPGSPPAPILSVRDLSLGYGPRTILKGITLELARGDYLGIVGPNGSGKSTFLMGLLGLLAPEAGSITQRVPLRFGYVPQSSSIDPIFPLSVDDVVRMGPGIIGSDPSVDVDHLLARVRLEAQRDRPFRELSGGQKQRVLLARALAMNPDVLILDEPTNGLDLPSEMAFLDLVREFHREGRNIIMVTHFLNLVANQADKIALIGGGRVVVGRGDELLTSESLTRVYGVPIHVGVTEGHRVVLPPSTEEAAPPTSLSPGGPPSLTASPSGEANRRTVISLTCLAALSALFLIPAIPSIPGSWPLSAPRHSILALGLTPLLLWLLVRHIVRWPGTMERAAGTGGALLALPAIHEVIARILAETPTLPPYVPEVTAALLLGSGAAWLLVRAGAGAGLGMGLGLYATALLLAGAVHRLPALVESFHHRDPLIGMALGLGHLLIAAVLFRLVAAVHRRRMELPPRFLEAPDGTPVRIHVPFITLGIWPLLFALLLAGGLHAMLAGTREVFTLQGSWMDRLLAAIAPGSWGGALITAISLLATTPLAFHMLHPLPRLAALSGHGQRDLETIFRPWIENELVQHAAYLALVVLASRAWLGGPLAPLGWGALALPVVVGTFAELADARHARRLLAEAGAPPVEVAACTDPLEAAIVQATLKKAGIHSMVHGWTARTVLPLSTTFLAVTKVLVSASMVERARAALPSRPAGDPR